MSFSELKGKAAIVTGASRGIGAATARQLCEHGARVVLTARTTADIETIAGEIRAAGGEAVALTCDVVRYGDVAAAVGRCVAEFGGLDILVNNAGVIEPIARLADSDPDGWSHAADINYKGVYNGLRAAIPVMRENGGGVIVNISSGAATSPLEGWSHYCSAKAAQLMLTRCAHLEYAADGIRVVGLSPGTVATQMQVEIKASGLNPVSRLDPSVHIPPEAAARAVCWLCTDPGRDYDGGDMSLRDEGARRKAGLAPQ